MRSFNHALARHARERSGNATAARARSRGNVSPGDPIRKLVKRAIRATTARTGLVVTAGVRGSSQTRAVVGGGSSSRSRAVCAEAQEASGRRRLERGMRRTPEGLSRTRTRGLHLRHTDTRPCGRGSHVCACVRTRVACRWPHTRRRAYPRSESRR